MVLLNFSNPGSGTFELSIFGLGGTVGAVGIVIWGKSGSEKVEKLGFGLESQKNFSL